MSTSFQPQNNEDVVNKAQLDTNISIVKCHISFIEKNLNDFILHGDEGRQSDDEFVIEKSVKTTTQILYDKRLLDMYDNAQELLKEYLLIELKERCRPDVKELKDDIVTQ